MGCRTVSSEGERESERERERANGKGKGCEAIEEFKRRGGQDAEPYLETCSAGNKIGVTWWGLSS